MWISHLDYIADVHNEDGKVILGIGTGGNENDDEEFSALVHDDEKIEKFATDVVSFLEKYQLDGLDVDWISPVCWGRPHMYISLSNVNQLILNIHILMLLSRYWEPTCQGPESDKPKFTEFLQKLKIQLAPRNYSLSATLASWPWMLTKGYELRNLSIILDFVNIKTVDMKGAWDGVVGAGDALKGHDEINCFVLVHVLIAYVTTNALLLYAYMTIMHLQRLSLVVAGICYVSFVHAITLKR